jgi:hypothetical protein
VPSLLPVASALAISLAGVVILLGSLKQAGIVLAVVCCFKRRWSIASQEDPICGSIFKRIYGYLASPFGAIFAPISRLNKPPLERPS